MENLEDAPIYHPKKYIPKPKMYGEGRPCKNRNITGCITKLRSTNPGPFCDGCNMRNGLNETLRLEKIVKNVSKPKSKRILSKADLFKGFKEIKIPLKRVVEVKVIKALPVPSDSVFCEKCRIEIPRKMWHDHYLMHAFDV